MKKIKSLQVFYNEKKVGTLALMKNNIVAFEYDNEWVNNGLNDILKVAEKIAIEIKETVRKDLGILNKFRIRIEFCIEWNLILFLIIAAIIIWSLSGLLVKAGNVDPLWISLIRCLGGGIFLLPYIFKEKIYPMKNILFGGIFMVKV